LQIDGKIFQCSLNSYDNWNTWSDGFVDIYYRIKKKKICRNL